MEKNFVVSAFGVADGVGERRRLRGTSLCPTGSILPPPKHNPKRFEEKARSAFVSNRMPSQHGASYIVGAGRFATQTSVWRVSFSPSLNNVSSVEWDEERLFGGNEC